MTAGEVKLSELKRDKETYPRHRVDASHVADIARAMKAGCDIPPIVVDAKSLRIVDGWHRSLAWEKVRGPDGVIEADLRSYASEKEFVLDCVELNAANARKLDQWDRTKSALLLEKHGYSIQEIAVAMHTTTERVSVLRARVVIVQGADGTSARQPAKPVSYPLPGELPSVLSPGQYRVMVSSGGNRTPQTVSQLIREFGAGLVNLAEPGLASKLWELHDLIEEHLPPRQAAA